VRKSLCDSHLLSAPVQKKEIQKLRSRDRHRFYADPPKLGAQASLGHPESASKRFVGERPVHERGKNPRLLRGEGVLRAELRNFFIKRTHHLHHP